MNKKIHEKNRRWEDWEELLKQHKLSGMGVGEFCAINKISRSNFYQWREKLGRRAEEHRLKEFIPITISEEKEEFTKEGRFSVKIETGLRIKSIKGISIEFERGCSAKDLKSVLEVLNAVE